MVKKNKFSKKRCMIIGLCLVLLLATWFIYAQAVRAKDRQRFKEAETVRNQIVEQLAEHLGDNVKEISDHDECFNTEQGPYDNGRLWCQVATSITVEQDVSYKVAGEAFLDAGEDLGLHTKSLSGDFPRFWAELEGGVTCQLQYRSAKNDDLGGARRITLEDGPALAVACADRAKAKHYPYTE